MSALAQVQASLARIAARDHDINAFTAVLSDRALARAAALDARGEELPLAGVPFAVKNLFDVAGLPTLAGRQDRAGRGTRHARRRARAPP